MKLTKDNYFSKDAMQSYWSVSQFKEFCKCEACGLASAKGEYRRKETDSLLIGSYVDAYFSGELEDFKLFAPVSVKVKHKIFSGLVSVFFKI